MTVYSLLNEVSVSERKAPGLIRRSLNFLYVASAISGGVTLCVICAAMLIQVITRFFGVLVGGTDEIAAWACAAAAFLPLAHTLRHGEMVRLSLVLSRLGPAKARSFEVFALTITSAFCIYATYHFAVMVYDSWRFGDMSQGLLIIPMWIPQFSLVFGFGVFTVSVIDALVTTLFGGRPSYLNADPDHPDLVHIAKE